MAGFDWSALNPFSSRNTGADAGRQQQDLVDSFRSAANGQAPSAADLQFKNMSDQLIRQQHALAASNPGLSPAQATYGAMQGAATIGQGVAGQQATLRAQEQARAREQLAQLLAQMRGGDRQQGQDAMGTWGKIGNVVGSALMAI